MKTSACRDGTLKNQPNWMGMTPQYFNTIPASCAILPPLTQLCFVCLLVMCRGLQKAVWWVVLGVHVDVHGEWVMLWVASMCNACTCCTEHGRYGLSCLYAATVEFMSSASWVCMVCMVCMVHMYMACLICWSLSYVVKFYCC